MRPPETKHTKVGDSSIDYQVMGDGPIVCSRTVKDLVAGSEFAFDDRGLCTLKGVPDQWQLYAVSQS